MFMNSVKKFFQKPKDEEEIRECSKKGYDFDDSPYVYEGKCIMNSLSSQCMMAVCWVETIIIFPECTVYDFEHVDNLSYAVRNHEKKIIESVPASERNLKEEQLIFREFLELWGDKTIHDLDAETGALENYFIQAHKNGDLFKYVINKMRNEAGLSRSFETHSRISDGLPKILLKATSLHRVANEESGWLWGLSVDGRLNGFLRERENFSKCRMCGSGKGGKKMTNFERIKGMNVEELAEFLLSVNDVCYLPCKWIDERCKHFGTDKGCKDCFKEWLESECDAEC